MNDMKMVEKIKIMEMFDNAHARLDHNLTEFKSKFPKIFATEEVDFYLGIDNIPPEPNKHFLNFEVFCWYEFPRDNFILRKLSKRLEHTKFRRNTKKVFEKYYNELGQMIFISDEPKMKMFDEIVLGFPEYNIDDFEDEQKEDILNCCFSGAADVKGFFDEILEIDFKEIEFIFTDYEVLSNRIEIIDETGILDRHSNSGRAKTIIFRTQKDKYKLHIHAESYDFQSYATLSIWSDVNKKWHEIRTTNPIKEHGLNFRISNDKWDGTNFDDIIWNYIRFIDKFEE